MTVLTVRTSIEVMPLARPFIISRGTKTEAPVVLVELWDGTHTGRGEATPLARYNDSTEQALAQIEAVKDRITDRDSLQALLPHGAARNAVDCALWDLEAKREGMPAWRLAGLPDPAPIVTAYTISLGEPEAMAEQAAQEKHRPLLKLKLGGLGDDRRVAAVRKVAPDATLIVDANEAWTEALFPKLAAAMEDNGVALIEQPLPAGSDEPLAHFDHPVPVCADESCHTRADLDRLVGLYDYINIKLDKTGGLTEALALAREARARDFGLMVGCMLGSSLAMAPAHLVAQLCRFVDIDGPLMLKQDRPGGLVFEGSSVQPPVAALWG